LPPNTTQVSTPLHIAQALGHAWAPTFGGKFINESLAKTFLAQYSSEVRWDWSYTLPPSLSSFSAFLNRAKFSAPGPDGIPFLCWKLAGDTGLQILDKVLYNSIDKKPRIDKLNDGLWIFVVKKALPTDPIDSMNVMRDAIETRPLTCKNSDIKTIAGCTASSVSAVCKNTIHKSERCRCRSSDVTKCGRY